MPSDMFAQKWKRRPWDGIMAIGTTHFMGDLGGGKGDASHFMGVKDFDFAATRPVVQVGLRYRVLERLSLRWNMTAGLLGGDDMSSGHEGRKYRNLHFRSVVAETNFQAEFYFIKEQISARYLYSSVKGWPNISAYLFAGIGGFYYNPQAELDGVWHNLRELGTEGQGIGDNPAQYGKFALSFPVGIGVKYSVDRFWSVGAELSVRYSSSDYLDDVSGEYFDTDLISNTYGSIAAELSDRHIPLPYETAYDGHTLPYSKQTMKVSKEGGGEEIVPRPAPKRGSPTFNDAFLYLNFNVSYRFRYGLFGGMFGGGGRAKY